MFAVPDWWWPVRRRPKLVSFGLSWRADHAGEILQPVPFFGILDHVWLAISGHAQWRNPEDVKASHPKVSVLNGSRVVLQHQGQRLPISCSRARRVRQNRRGDGMMDATLIVIDSDAELARARALVDRLMSSANPANIARLQA